MRTFDIVVWVQELIEVSRHKIYRFVRSDLASSTRPGEAHTFLRVLAANGATCRARPIWPSRP